MGEPRRLPVTVAVDVDELREWAGRHADAGHHGVAHVLYQAAADVESITEQHDRETAARALAPIRAALDAHPVCDVHPDDDPVSCGWKRAVADVRRALDA